MFYHFHCLLLLSFVVVVVVVVRFFGPKFHKKAIRNSSRRHHRFLVAELQWSFNLRNVLRGGRACPPGMSWYPAGNGWFISHQTGKPEKH